MGLELKRAMREINLRVKPIERLLEIISLCYCCISTCQERPCGKRASGLTEKVIYIWSMRGGAMGRTVKTNRDRMFLYKRKQNVWKDPVSTAQDHLRKDDWILTGKSVSEQERWGELSQDSGIKGAGSARQIVLHRCQEEGAPGGEWDTQGQRGRKCWPEQVGQRAVA